MKTTATKHPGMYQPPAGHPVLHTVRDAAAHIGLSESTIRAKLRRLGARVGRRVCGMVEIAGGYIPYDECVHRLGSNAC